MKMERLVGIIMVLLQQEQATAPELARRFEVSRRTISRDIEEICKAGIPLVTTQGYGGGISIAEGYKVDKALFTQEEIQTILTGLKGLDSVSKAPISAGLLEKLSSRTAHVRSDDAVILDLSSHGQGPLAHKIDLLKAAIRARNTVSFTYYYPKGECLRRIEPYQLVFKWSSWYVFGYCLDRADFRLFKLNRLWNLAVNPGCFQPRDIPPQKADHTRYFAESAFHLKALFADSEKYRLIEEYGIESYSAAPNNQLLFERDFVRYENMREWILSFGGRVRVLEPDLLKAELCQEAQTILSYYKGHDI